MIFSPRSPGLVGTISDGGIDTVSGLGLTTDTGNRVSTTFGDLVLFNGSNRAQNTNHPLVTPAFSVSFSYKYKAPQGSIQNVLVHQGGYNPGGKGWNLSVYSGNVYITFGGVADHIICSIATAGFAVDGAYRVTLTVSGNGGTARLYVDGVQKGSVTVGTMLTPAHHSTTIGCGYSGSSSSYTYYVASGVGIGELFLYNRELTEQEALDDYNSKDGAQTVSPSLLTNSQTFYAPAVTVASGTQTITPTLLTNSQTFYAPTVSVTSGPQTIFPHRLTNVQTFFAPTITGGATPAYAKSPIGRGYPKRKETR